MALAGRKLDSAVAAAGVDGAEKGEELGPGAVALVHEVRVVFVIGAEFLEESLNRVVLLIEFAGRHEAAVFGVEEEDEAQEGGDEAAVDFLGVALPGVR